MRTSEQIKTEIEETFGFFPPFFVPAQLNPQVLDNLWQQTLSAYVNNPLSPQFKEKLSAYLSRYCAVPYCMICHSCSLYALGIKAREILNLLESPPPGQTDIDDYLYILTHSPDIRPGSTLWGAVLEPNSAGEVSLLYCTIYSVLAREQAQYYRNELRQLLGPGNYQHLVTLVTWVKTCNAWMETHPEVPYEADQRAQNYLRPLLEEEPNLADFFHNYREKVGREQQSVVEALRLSEEKFFKAFRSSPDSITISTLAEGRYLEVNDGCLRMSGYQRSDMIGHTAEELQIWEDLSEREWMVQQLRETGWMRDMECRLRTKVGSVRTALLSAEVITFEGQICLLAIGRDITERKASEEQLIRTAFYDSLTGLGNRALFMERLQLAMENHKRDSSKSFAVLFLDLDRFKVINDSLGHFVGDQLLIAIASRLRSCLRPVDLATRLGGDEFTILLVQISDISDAIRVAERIQAQLRLPFSLDGHEVVTTASIGIAVSEGDLGSTAKASNSYNRPEDMLRNADIAMYRAKAHGRARYEIFDPSMHSRAVARLQLEIDLRQAIEHQEFQTHYQPIVALGTGRIAGFEALVRWQHPRHGLLTPGDFISVAEETGLSVLIDQWVLYEACRQTHQWQELSTNRPIQARYPALSVNVNLCNSQFAQSNLHEHISQVLQDTGLDAASLKLELTENVIMENDEFAATILSQLKALGVQLAVDDFGTGYSSLARLHRFPIDMLKIDRSFVSRIGRDEGTLEFVRGILALAHYLDVEVTAEGVETAEQLEQLRALNCKYGQGYFFARPLAAAEAEALLNAQPRW